MSNTQIRQLNKRLRTSKRNSGITSGSFGIGSEELQDRMRSGQDTNNDLCCYGQAEHEEETCEEPGHQSTSMPQAHCGNDDSFYPCGNPNCICYLANADSREHQRSMNDSACELTWNQGTVLDNGTITCEQQLLRGLNPAKNSTSKNKNYHSPQHSSKHNTTRDCDCKSESSHDVVVNYERYDPASCGGPSSLLDKAFVDLVESFQNLRDRIIGCPAMSQGPSTSNADNNNNTRLFMQTNVQTVKTDSAGNVQRSKTKTIKKLNKYGEMDTCVSGETVEEPSPAEALCRQPPRKQQGSSRQAERGNSTKCPPVGNIQNLRNKIDGHLGFSLPSVMSNENKNLANFQNKLGATGGHSQGTSSTAGSCQCSHHNDQQNRQERHTSSTPTRYNDKEPLQQASATIMNEQSACMNNICLPNSCPIYGRKTAPEQSRHVKNKSRSLSCDCLNDMYDTNVLYNRSRSCPSGYADVSRVGNLLLRSPSVEEELSTFEKKPSETSPKHPTYRQRSYPTHNTQKGPAASYQKNDSASCLCASTISNPKRQTNQQNYGKRPQCTENYSPAMPSEHLEDITMPSCLCQSRNGSQHNKHSTQPSANDAFGSRSHSERLEDISMPSYHHQSQISRHQSNRQQNTSHKRHPTGNECEHCRASKSQERRDCQSHGGKKGKQHPVEFRKMILEKKMKNFEIPAMECGSTLRKTESKRNADRNQSPSSCGNRNEDNSFPTNFKETFLANESSRKKRQQHCSSGNDHNTMSQLMDESVPTGFASQYTNEYNRSPQRRNDNASSCACGASMHGEQLSNITEPSGFHNRTMYSCCNSPSMNQTPRLDDISMPTGLNTTSQSHHSPHRSPQRAHGRSGPAQYLPSMNISPFTGRVCSCYQNQSTQPDKLCYTCELLENASMPSDWRNVGKSTGSSCQCYPPRTNEQRRNPTGSYHSNSKPANYSSQLLANTSIPSGMQKNYTMSSAPSYSSQHKQCCCVDKSLPSEQISNITYPGDFSRNNQTSNSRSRCACQHSLPNEQLEDVTMPCDSDESQAKHIDDCPTDQIADITMPSCLCKSNNTTQHEQWLDDITSPSGFDESSENACGRNLSKASSKKHVPCSKKKKKKMTGNTQGIGLFKQESLMNMTYTKFLSEIDERRAPSCDRNIKSQDSSPDKHCKKSQRLSKECRAPTRDTQQHADDSFDSQYYDLPSYGNEQRNCLCRKDVELDILPYDLPNRDGNADSFQQPQKGMCHCRKESEGEQKRICLCRKGVEPDIMPYDLPNRPKHADGKADYFQQPPESYHGDLPYENSSRGICDCSHKLHSGPMIPINKTQPFNWSNREQPSYSYRNDPALKKEDSQIPSTIPPCCTALTVARPQEHYSDRLQEDPQAFYGPPFVTTVQQPGQSFFPTTQELGQSFLPNSQHPAQAFVPSGQDYGQAFVPSAQHPGQAFVPSGQQPGQTIFSDAQQPGQSFGPNAQPGQSISTTQKPGVHDVQIDALNAVKSSGGIDPMKSHDNYLIKGYDRKVSIITERPVYGSASQHGSNVPELKSISAENLLDPNFPLHEKFKPSGSVHSSIGGPDGERSTRTTIETSEHFYTMEVSPDKPINVHEETIVRETSYVGDETPRETVQRISTDVLLEATSHNLLDVIKSETVTTQEVPDMSTKIDSIDGIPVEQFADRGADDMQTIPSGTMITDMLYDSLPLMEPISVELDQGIEDFSPRETVAEPQMDFDAPRLGSSLIERTSITQREQSITIEMKPNVSFSEEPIVSGNEPDVSVTMVDPSDGGEGGSVIEVVMEEKTMTRSIIDLNEEDPSSPVFDIPIAEVDTTADIMDLNTYIEDLPTMNNDLDGNFGDTQNLVELIGIGEDVEQFNNFADVDYTSGMADVIDNPYVEDMSYLEGSVPYTGEDIPYIDNDMFNIEIDMTNGDGDMTFMGDIPYMDEDTVNMEGDMLNMDGDFAFMEGDLNFMEGNMSFMGGDMDFMEGDMSFMEGDMPFMEGEMSFVDGEMPFIEDEIPYMEIDMMTTEGEEGDKVLMEGDNPLDEGEYGDGDSNGDLNEKSFLGEASSIDGGALLDNDAKTSSVDEIIPPDQLLSTSLNNLEEIKQLEGDNVSLSVKPEIPCDNEDRTCNQNLVHSMEQLIGNVSNILTLNQSLDMLPPLANLIPTSIDDFHAPNMSDFAMASIAGKQHLDYTSSICSLNDVRHLKDEVRFDESRIIYPEDAFEMACAKCGRPKRPKPKDKEHHCRRHHHHHHGEHREHRCRSHGHHCSRAQHSHPHGHHSHHSHHSHPRSHHSHHSHHSQPRVPYFHSLHSLHSHHRSLHSYNHSQHSHYLPYDTDAAYDEQLPIEQYDADTSNIPRHRHRHSDKHRHSTHRSSKGHDIQPHHTRELIPVPYAGHLKNPCKIHQTHEEEICPSRLHHHHHHGHHTDHDHHPPQQRHSHPHTRTSAAHHATGANENHHRRRSSSAAVKKHTARRSSSKDPHE